MKIINFGAIKCPVGRNGLILDKASITKTI